MKIFEDNSTGEQIKIMNIHLDRRSEISREKTIELVLRKLIAEADPMPILVVGDFNVRPTNPVIQRKEEFFVGTFEGDILAACTYHDYYDGSHSALDMTTSFTLKVMAL